jgi:two-component system sensor histidine kinase BarA
MNLSLVRALIHEMGLEVDLAEGGEEALTLCRQYFYPLILMDIQMPDMDGVACLKALRNFAQYRNAGNVVALTAYALPREKNEFIQQGFVDLITKPLDEAKLQAIILRYLPETKQLADLETAKPSDLESLQPLKSLQRAKSPRPIKNLQPVKSLQRMESPQQIESLPPENTPPRTDANNKQGAPRGASIQRNEHSYEEDFENLPIFDWNESVHLSNGNESLAREFAQKLFLTLPEAHKDISASFNAKDKEQLLHSVHKLHGVTLLCGIPKLRYLAYRSEDSLKTGQDESSLNNIIEALLDAVEELIDCGDHVLATHAPV